MKRILIVILTGLFALTFSSNHANWDWAASAGGSGWDAGNSIAIDSAGKSYLTGYFSNTADFGTISLTSAGEQDIFVAKIDPGGNWVWVERAGGLEMDSGTSIVLDNDDYIYVTGYFSDTADFGTSTLTSIGGRDIFIARLDPEGDWLWAERAGGISNDYSFSITLDSLNNILITGRFYDTADFGDIELTSDGGADLFVAKLDGDGNWLWVEQGGGEEFAEGISIVCDSNDNVLVSGSFIGTAEFGDSIVISIDREDLFVAKLSSGGDWLWARRAGGLLVDIGHSLVTDADDNVYVTGEFQLAADFGDIILESGSAYLSDAFVAKLNADGDWLWAEQATGSATVVSRAIAVNNDNNLVISGNYWHNVLFGDILLTGGGGFAAIIDSDGNWLWAEGAGDTDSLFCYSLAVNAEDELYLTGAFGGYALFDSFLLASSGLRDIFIAKYDFSLDINLPVAGRIYAVNYPNPFNPSTTILFDLPHSGEIVLDIYNIRGQKVAELLRDYKAAGRHKIIWNGKDYSGRAMTSGVYFYKISTTEETTINKITLLK